MKAELKYARTGEPDTPSIIEPNFVSVLLAFPGKHFGDISAQHNEVPELTALSSTEMPASESYIHSLDHSSHLLCTSAH